MCSKSTTRSDNLWFPYPEMPLYACALTGRVAMAHVQDPIVTDKSRGNKYNLAI